MNERLLSPLSKDLDLGGISYIEPVRGGSPGWYYGMDYPAGDPYEAMEIWQSGRAPEGTNFKLIHWPDGTVYTPLEKRPGLVIGSPAANAGTVYLLAIDFPAGKITVYEFGFPEGAPGGAGSGSGVCAPSGAGHSAQGSEPRLRTLAELPLSEGEDCYNLMLHTRPLTLSLQGNGRLDDGREAYRFRMIWPQKACFEIGPNESFGEREGDLLYFSAWYEDPDYREETVVRSAADGAVLGTLEGDVVRMPDGTLWRVR